MLCTLTGVGKKGLPGILVLRWLRAPNFTCQTSVSPVTFKAGMFVYTTRTGPSSMERITVTSGDSMLLLIIIIISSRCTATGRLLRSQPQLPVDLTPGERCPFGLTEETKVLVIEYPIVASGCQISNNFTIFHQVRSLCGVPTCVYRNKNVKGLHPHIYCVYFSGFS